jgi:hypothetical protein
MSINSVQSLKRQGKIKCMSLFLSYLTRHGNKAKFLKYLLTAIRNYQNNLSTTNFNLDWKFLFYSLNHLNVMNTLVKKSNLIIFSKSHFDVESLVKLILKKLNLLFIFYIYKVDKNIYKNSRGKSGKHTFVWKYVPPYKRMSTMLHWISKEIKITQSKNLKSKIFLTLSKLAKSPTKTWIFRVGRFSLNYVYYNLRKTLSETYKTALK